MREPFSYVTERYLASTIEEFWRRRGMAVKVTLEPIKKYAKTGIQLYATRSDMVNGLPKEFAK
jgi:hypothetical protein